MIVLMLSRSGYMLFCKEIIPTLKDVPSRERMLEASNRWGVLAEEKKTEYNKKVKEAMKIYLTELEAFKEVSAAVDGGFMWCFVGTWVAL